MHRQAMEVRTFGRATVQGGLAAAAWWGMGAALPEASRRRFLLSGLPGTADAMPDLAANTCWPFALLVGDRS